MSMRTPPSGIRVGGGILLLRRNSDSDGDGDGDGDGHTVGEGNAEAVGAAATFDGGPSLQPSNTSTAAETNLIVAPK